MVGELAKKHFTGQKGYKRLNCAQSMAEIFKDRFDFLSDNTVREFKKMGYGRAPNGECGMLFAAKYILEKSGNEDQIKKMDDFFKNMAGTVLCKELKKKKIPFCARCLEHTADYVNSLLQNRHMKEMKSA